MLLVILVLMLGSANKLKTARQIALTGAVSGNTNFDGSGNVSITTKQANIAVLTGNFSLNSSGYTSDINYPDGYNKNNCIVIAFGLVTQNDSNAKGYNFGGTYSDSGDLLNNALSRDVSLRDSQIRIRVKNPGNSGNYTYKIVLMKIS